MVTGDCGGVREHGAFGNGSIEEPERSTVVSARSGNEQSETSRVCWTNGAFLRKANAAVKSDSLIVLRAQESCAHGEAAKQMKADFRETSPPLTEAGA
jgi:hypothetical protein